MGWQRGGALKFTCPKCQTRYSLADDKVPAGKTLRFSCKKCGNVVRLRHKNAQTGDAQEETATNPKASAPDPAAAAQPKSAFVDAVMAEGVPTRTLPKEAPELRKPKAETASPFAEPPPTPPPTPPQKSGAIPRWFVLVKGEQRGPLSTDDVADMVRSGELAPRSYAWCEGMAEWMRLRQLDPFREATAQVATEPLVDAAGTAGANAKGTPPPKPPPGGLPGEPNGVTDHVEGGLGARVAEAMGGKPHVHTDDPSPPSVALSGEAYLAAPPGEATRVFMATAGIYQRRRKNRAAAIIGAATTAFLIAVIMGDVTGFYEIPGMGLVYHATGISDPNKSRAKEIVVEKLHSGDLSPEERAALQKKLGLLGGEGGTARPPVRAVEKKREIAVEEGVKTTKKLTTSERQLAFDVFSDTRKQEVQIKPLKASDIQTPNLPEGLTQEAIFKVIAENKGSMSLCMAEAMKKGEALQGRMEVELTIGAAGKVSDAAIGTARFRTSTIGQCTVRTARRWRFPRFNGEPVTVIFPYVLSSGF